jgi:hypothetical protein
VCSMWCEILTEIVSRRAAQDQSIPRRQADIKYVPIETSWIKEMGPFKAGGRYGA